MPLSKKRMRERKKQDRSNLVGFDNKVVSNLVKPKQEKLVELRKLIERSVVDKEPVKCVPIFDPSVHKAGDLVRMKTPRGKLVEAIVPEVDGSGQAIPYYW